MTRVPLPSCSGTNRIPRSLWIDSGDRTAGSKLSRMNSRTRRSNWSSDISGRIVIAMSSTAFI